MKETQQVLKIFPLASHLVSTEMLSILGDKYNNALSFRWELTRDFSAAHIVLWDGVVTIKNEPLIQAVTGKLNIGKVLLLVNASTTFLKSSFTAKVAELEHVTYVEIRGCNTLPEELISAIEACHKKLGYV